LARAWLDTVLEVYAAREHKAFHTVTRVRGVSADGEPRIYQAAEELLQHFDLPPLNTVANTIFPAGLARRAPDIVELTRRYEELYPQLQRLEPIRNRDGTYFHRLVAYPGPNGPVNQLARVITNLNRELSSDSPKRARFETSLEIPGNSNEPSDDPGPHGDGHGLAGSDATPVFAAGRDNQLMGFPCLSFLSFQHDRTHLHAAAHYRSQYLMQRGLGNYLGIARLMRYVAGQVGLEPGRLTVIAGQAYADNLRKINVADLDELRTALRDASGATSVGADPPTGAR
jgi:hypothetical protein